ncbi:MAG: hypothetical protein QXM96_04120, partial [Candidatus Woesearchaeota archaeon]
METKIYYYIDENEERKNFYVFSSSQIAKYFIQPMGVFPVEHGKKVEEKVCQILYENKELLKKLLSLKEEIKQIEEELNDFCQNKNIDLSDLIYGNINNLFEKDEEVDIDELNLSVSKYLYLEKEIYEIEKLFDDDSNIEKLCLKILNYDSSCCFIPPTKYKVYNNIIILA